MHRVLCFLAVLLIAGCGSQPARPNFLARSLQDCANGDQQACAMLGSLATRTPAEPVADMKAEAQPRTQQQRDADAIMAGMRKARSSQPTQNMQIAPTSGA